MQSPGDHLEIQTIGAQAPVGVCGSGLLDVVAQMRRNNTISQKDVRELQLAKAAIRTRIRALVQAEGLAENNIEQVIEATYLCR